MTERRADISAWLRRRTPEHLEYLDRMRTTLLANLPQGTTVVPDRDWARVANLYQTAFHALLTEERERAKLALMAQLKGGGQVLSDEEFAAGMRDLALNSVRELDTSDLVAELTRRGLTLPSAMGDGEGDAS